MIIEVMKMMTTVTTLVTMTTTMMVVLQRTVPLGTKAGSSMTK